MAYQIDRYDKTLLTVVEDGTIDQSTDLNFVGKNYAGYGEIHNENFLFLLENFAGANPPPRAISGQVWFDSTLSKLKFYDGTKWRTTGGAETTGTAPSGLTEGDFWWDTANEQLYAYNGTDFILIGPQDAGEGVTQMQSRSVRDNTGTTHSVIVSVINDSVVHIVSNVAFTIDNTDAENVIPGFDVVKKGLTLVNTEAFTGGETSEGYVFWGTASDAKKLNGLDASRYVTTTPGEITKFDSAVQFEDAGFSVGDSNDLQVYVPSNTDNKIAITNEIGNTIFLSAKSESGVKNSIRVTPDALLPGVTGITVPEESYVLESVNIGTEAAPFAEVVANNFTGLSEKATALVVDGNNRQGAIGATANTVAVRDASGDLRANLFVGTALTAKFADLAEKYTTEDEYSVGTIVAVCGHEEHEMALATPTSVVAGVISEKPAFLMNEDSDGQAVALKGRVPVRVVGSVKKGDSVFVHQNGLASVDGNGDLVGVALESNSTIEEKLVECFLKV